MMTAVLVIMALGVALVAGWALIQLGGASRGAPSPAGGDLMVLEHSPVGALLLDPALRVTWANDTFCRFFGLNRAEVVGHKMPDLIQSHLKAAVAEPAAFESGLLTAYAPGGTATALDIHVIPQGTRLHRWLEHMSHVIKQGPLQGSRVEYFVNVTPLRHAALHQEAEVRRRGELNQTLVDLSRQRTLASGDRSTALREVSRAAVSTLGGAYAALWLLSEDRDHWVLDHHFDSASKRCTTVDHRVDASTVQEYLGVIEEIRVLGVTDVANDPRSGGLVGQTRLDPEAGARLDVPVRIRGQVAGALVLADLGSRIWTSEEEQFAASVGDRLSLILEATVGRDLPTTPIDQPNPPMDPDPMDGLVHLDEDLVFTYLNPTVLQWLEERGHGGEDLVGRGLVESLRNVEDNSIIAEIRKAARGGGPARLRRQLESDGPWLDVYIHPVENGVSVTLQNRARRHEHEAERSLRESETRFRSVVESLGEGLIITDLADRIIYVNPRIAALTGHRQEDLAGRTAQDLLFVTETWPNAQVRLDARTDRTRRQYEAPLRHKDGHVIFVEVISNPLRNADGDVTGVVDAVTDLSTRPGQEPPN